MMQYSGLPMLSILTPSKNRARLLVRAIESVQTQDYRNVEHLILDGGSTDNTLALIQEYPGIRVYSETDSGMYEALNRGLEEAKGQIIGFLNSDDFYTGGVFESVSRLFHEKQQIDAVFGKAQVFRITSDQGLELREIVQPLRKHQLWDLLADAPAFNAWFFRKEVFERIGGFDTTLKFAADRDFLIRFYLEDMQYLSLDKVVYCYRSHSDSMTIDPEKRNEGKMREEHLQIAEKCLKLNSLSHQHRRDFRKWHTYNSVELVRQLIDMREIIPAWNILRRGVAKNLLWPFAFIRRNLHVLIDSMVH